MAYQASSSGCDSSLRGIQGSLTGRPTREPVRNWWPTHDMTPRSDFVSERHRTALMWKL